MTRITHVVFACVAVTALIAWAAASNTGVRAQGGQTEAAAAEPSPVAPLPVLGTRLSDYPDGPGQDTARSSCRTCHSADLARQQRLTEKQWAATVDKMMRWGSVVPDDKHDELIAYLARNFGPDNKGFEPIVASPAVN